MPITDTFGSWSDTAANNPPAGTATPEIDDEIRNMKAEMVKNCVILTGNQAIGGVKTFSSIPVLPSTDCASDDEAARKAYVDSKAATLSSADKLIQVVRTSLSSFVSTAAYMTADDSKPQITEGAELMSLAITPTSTDSKLEFSVVVNGTVSATTNTMIIGLFEGTGTDAIAVAAHTPPAGNYLGQAVIQHSCDAPSTEATTYSVRGGVDIGGNLLVNGNAGTRLFGGVYISTLKISEFAE